MPEKIHLEKIDALVEHEKMISELYQAYAVIFPRSRSLWQTLIEDEQTHIKWLEGLVPSVGQGVITFNEQKFPLAGIKTAISFIRNQIQLLRTQTVTEKQALITARNLEEAMIESKFFQVYESTNLEYVRLFRKLIAQTKEHREKLDQAIREESNY